VAQRPHAAQRHAGVAQAGDGGGEGGHEVGAEGHQRERAGREQPQVEGEEGDHRAHHLLGHHAAAHPHRHHRARVQRAAHLAHAVLDDECRAYVAILLVGGLLLTLALLPSFGLWDALRHGVFQAVSLTTTTGFVSDDVSAWSLPAQALLVAFMFIGGSAGSAAGGVKVVRWLIVVKHSVREVRRALHPRAVMPVRVGRRVVPEEVMRAVVAFLTLYLGLFAAGTLTLVTLGADFVTAFTAAI